jgi:hypothetical protein
MIAARHNSTAVPCALRRHRRSLLVVLAAPAIAVVVASFLPWTERASRQAGAPIGLLEVIVLAVVVAAALEAYCSHPASQVVSLAVLTYAWACTFTAVGLSSTQANRPVRHVPAVGDDLVLRSGFYIAAAALVIASAGWVLVALGRRAESTVPRLAGSPVGPAAPAFLG